jgi:hypothetical protein
MIKHLVKDFFEKLIIFFCEVLQALSGAGLRVFRAALFKTFLEFL